MIISVFVALCCYLLGFLWFLGVLYLLFRVVDWLMLVLVIGAVVYLLRSFYGIVCELSCVVGALVTVGIRVVVIGFCEWLVVFAGSCLFGISVVLVFLCSGY